MDWEFVGKVMLAVKVGRAVVEVGKRVGVVDMVACSATGSGAGKPGRYW